MVIGALALLPPGAAAQQVQPRIPPAPPAAASSAGAREAIPAQHRHSLLTSVLYGAGGAVLGGWAGYMTSQIVWSDWQKATRPGGVSRLHYTLTGAGIGAVLGAFLGRHSTPGAAPGRPIYGILPAITTAQIQASATHNVQELIQLLRPQWLNPRGNDIVQIADSTAPPRTGFAGEDVVRVYLDGEPLGGPDQLADIPTPQALRVEYYDMKAATLRWGAGHSHGAINVITAKGQP